MDQDRLHHTGVNGRPQVLLMIERLIEYISRHEGECWATMEQIDGEFRRMFPFSGTIRRHTAVYRPPLGSLPVRCCAPSVSPTEPVAGQTARA
jgi:hypothetical protein